MDEELLTPEDAQRRVLEYVKSAAKSPESDDSRPLSDAGIEKALAGIPREHVAEALVQLVEKNRLRSANVILRVYVPANSDGARVLREMTVARGIHFSQAWAIFISTAILGFGLHWLNAYQSYDGPFGPVQKQAFNDALFFAALICVPTGAALSHYAGRFIRWKLTSDADYVTISAYARWSAIAAVTTSLAYLGYVRTRGVEFDIGVCSTIVALGVGVACAIVAGLDARRAG